MFGYINNITHVVMVGLIVFAVSNAISSVI